MLYWTKEEYLLFAEEMMYNPDLYYAFEMLYWCGLRKGEMLALTPADFDLKNGTVSITKTYYRKDKIYIYRLCGKRLFPKCHS